MNITDKRIDGGKAFDWGRTSADYARYRDIYPPEFYSKILSRGLCGTGSRVLDLGTGTGVLPRNLAKYGAEWVGTDISENQIEQAKRLSEEAGLSIEYLAASAETLPFEAGSFDTVTACQCFWYFDHAVVMPRLAELLRDGGKLVVLYMAWLPFEDAIAGASEELVLRYNPSWTGAGETRHPIWIPDIADKYFRLTDHEEFDLNVPFTKESWHGRMKACRGVGASLSPDELAGWERDHRELLDRIAPDAFEVKHYGAIAVLEKR